MPSARHAKPRPSRRAAVTPPPAPGVPGAPGGRHRAPAARGGTPSPAAVGAAAAAVAAAGVVVVPTLGSSPDGTSSAAPTAEALVASVAEALTGVTPAGRDRYADGSPAEATSTDLARPVLPLARIATGRAAAAERAGRDTARPALAPQQAMAAGADLAAVGSEPAQSAAAQPAAGTSAGPAGPADLAAARDRARSLLDAKVADIAKAAERAAAAAVPAALDRRGCGYSPGAQKRPALGGEQMRNVRAIVDVAQEMGLSPRAAVIALATAQQESWLKNLSWGDRDSLGLFQQRPSMGWGSSSQIRDPEYAARSFYRALKDVDGWQNLPLTVAAQRVQRSAFPSAYARWELMAAKLVQNELDAPADRLGCRAG